MNHRIVIAALIIALSAPLAYWGISTYYNVQPVTSSTHAQRQSTGPWITVWIHGTRMLTRPFFKKFFHVDLGLKKATRIGAEYHHREIADTLSEIDEHRFCLDRFYLFGWSGHLSFEARHQAAQELCDALQELITTYQKEQNITPRIRLITHSHGGNVALNLADIVPEISPFLIDELVMMACPVQERTKELIDSDCFKRIYSLYSSRDIIQVLDPQGWYPGGHKKDLMKRKWFSGRLFPPHPKLTQALITYNGRGIMHAEFLLCQHLCGFVQHFPEILTTLEQSEIRPRHVSVNIDTDAQDETQLVVAAA